MQVEVKTKTAIESVTLKLSEYEAKLIAVLLGNMNTRGNHNSACYRMFESLYKNINMNINNFPTITETGWSIPDDVKI